MFTFFILLGFIVFNMVFYTIPFIFLAITREDILPYQICLMFYRPYWTPT